MGSSHYFQYNAKTKDTNIHPMVHNWIESLAMEWETNQSHYLPPVTEGEKS